MSNLHEFIKVRENTKNVKPFLINVNHPGCVLRRSDLKGRFESAFRSEKCRKFAVMAERGNTYPLSLLKSDKYKKKVNSKLVLSLAQVFLLKPSAGFRKTNWVNIITISWALAKKMKKYLGNSDLIFVFLCRVLLMAIRYWERC
jgi:hypothetical protein